MHRICHVCNTVNAGPFTDVIAKCCWNSDHKVFPAIGEVIEKDWGTTKCIFEVPNLFYIMEAFIKAGGKSSFGAYHRHDRYSNTFTVLSGELWLNVNMGYSYNLTSFDKDFTIGPKYPHRFEALQDTHLIEVYKYTDNFSSATPTSIYEDTIREATAANG